MSSGLSDASRREARLITGGCTLLAGVCLASAVSPSIETAIGWGFTAGLTVAGLWALVRAVRSLWLSFLTDRECEQSLRDNAPAVKEASRRA